MHRTAEDARFDPVPGDIYHYPYRGAFDVVQEVRGDTVVVMDDRENVHRMTLTEWSSGLGEWAPDPADGAWVGGES